MPELYDPFARYVAQVLRHITRLPAEQRAAIADELRTHLDDAASEFGERAESQIVQELVVNQMGSSRRLGRALAKANRDSAARRVLLFTLLRAGVASLLCMVCLLCMLLWLFVVPPATPLTATVISGTVRSISAPHPSYGDMSIILEDGRSFYVNSADERDDFAWQQLRREVGRGDQITLTAVEPFAWLFNPLRTEPGRGISPLAGVRSGDTVYLNDAMAATTPPALFTPLIVAILLQLVAIAFVLPELRKATRWVRQFIAT